MIQDQTGSTHKVRTNPSEMIKNPDIEKTNTEQLITVDLGCGFLDRQRTDEESIGLDINFEHGKPKSSFPIMGDVQHLPIRDSTIQHVYARAILEHLPRADLCMKDMDRIMTPGASGTVLIPVNANMPQGIMGRFFKEFPFSIPWVLSKLWRSITLWQQCPELVHCTQVEIADLEKYFCVNKRDIKHGRRFHKWFVHYGPMVILIKLGILRTRLTVDEYADMAIKITKRQRA
jgi:hypothetical protein